MKRCVDSGLWCPAKDDPDTNTEDGFVKKEKGEGEDSEGEEGEGEKKVEEEIYDEVK